MNHFRTFSVAGSKHRWIWPSLALVLGNLCSAGCLADQAIHATGGGFHAAVVGQRAGEVS